MSEKHLLKFQTEADYRTAKKNHLLLPNVSSVVETGEVHINPKFVSKQNAEAGDIIVYHTHSNGEKEIAYMKPEAYDAATETYWEPDAIVVVPYSHTNDGTVRAMGLKYADLTSPSTGGSGSSMYWGQYGHIEGLNTYTSALNFTNYQVQSASATMGESNEVHLPSDKYNSKNNPYDTYTFYGNANNNYAPSPYNNEGGKNDAYFSTGDFSQKTNNALRDMDGKTNTLKILQSLDPNYLNYSLLKSELTNEISTTVGQTTINLYPAVCACARYSSVLKPYAYNANKTIEENVTEGLMPWYLPSAGELGYYLSREDRIKYALSKLGNKAASKLKNSLWSSSEGYTTDYFFEPWTAWLLLDLSSQGSDTPVMTGMFGNYNADRYVENNARPFAAF